MTDFSHLTNQDIALLKDYGYEPIPKGETVRPGDRWTWIDREQGISRYNIENPSTHITKVGDISLIRRYVMVAWRPITQPESPPSRPSPPSASRPLRTARDVTDFVKSFAETPAVATLPYWVHDYFARLIADIEANLHDASEDPEQLRAERDRWRRRVGILERRLAAVEDAIHPSLDHTRDPGNQT